MSDQASILKPNATKHDQAIEAAIRIGKPDLAVVARLMNPETCPAELLPWLAWGFSIEVWESSWSEEVKRQVIRDAVSVHRLKGTKGAVRKALAGLGLASEIAEWFENGGAPHTFFLDFTATGILEAGYVLSQSFVDQVDRVLHTVKPVRSHYQVRVSETGTNDVYVSPAFGEVMIDDAAMIMEMP